MPKKHRLYHCCQAEWKRHKLRFRNPAPPRYHIRELSPLPRQIRWLLVKSWRHFFNLSNRKTPWRSQFLHCTYQCRNCRSNLYRIVGWLNMNLYYSSKLLMKCPRMSKLARLTALKATWGTISNLSKRQCPKLLQQELLESSWLIKKWFTPYFCGDKRIN